MAINVRCTECGCFALQRRETLEIVSASVSYRKLGALDREAFHQMPVCAANAYDFHIWKDVPDDFHSVANSHRDCEQYVPWTPAFTPKEHIEMRQLREEREFHRQMIESERAWREQQAQADRAWKEQDRRAREEEARRVAQRHTKDFRAANLRLWIGFVVAVAVAILGHFLRLWFPVSG